MVRFSYQKISGKNFLTIPTFQKRFPTVGIGIKKKPYNREILGKNLIFRVGVESLFRLKNFLEKFFCDAYFRGAIFARDSGPF